MKTPYKHILPFRVDNTVDPSETGFRYTAQYKLAAKEKGRKKERNYFPFQTEVQHYDFVNGDIWCRMRFFMAFVPDQ